MMELPPVASDERATGSTEQHAAVRRQARPAAPARTQPDDAQLNAAVDRANKAVSRNNIQFTVDRASGKTIVRVMDAQTQQLIRQIPSQEMIDIARSIDRMQGMLLKHEA